jgi:hypothetical protein
MSSEYDPIRADPPESPEGDDLEQVRRRFSAASQPYLSRPWSWLAWSIILPVSALLTPLVSTARGGLGVLMLWSLAVLLGGLIEALQILRGRRESSASPVASWVLRSQGNLSLVALALSLVVLWQGLTWILPGLWLLLLGHSLFGLGGLAFSPLRTAGLIYQLGGAVALFPHGRGLIVFAAATFCGNAWVAWSIWRRSWD